MKPYTALPYVQRTPEWVEARKRLGITASEVAAVLGVSRYGGPFDVYSWHKGLRPDLIPTEEMEWGTLLEPVVADRAAEIEGLKIRRVNRLLRSREWPWLLCSLDRMCSDGSLGEVKTTGIYAKDWGEAETDQVPDDPMCQVQTQMAVTGAKLARVWALFGGQHLRRYLVPRDDELILDQIVPKTKAMWQRILDGNPPQVDGSDGCTEYLASRYPKGTGGSIEATEAVIRDASAYLAVNEELEDLEARKKTLRNRLVEALGENRCAMGKDVKVSLIDMAGSSYTVTRKPARVLRVDHQEA